MNLGYKHIRPLNPESPRLLGAVCMAILRHFSNLSTKPNTPPHAAVNEGGSYDGLHEILWFFRKSL